MTTTKKPDPETAELPICFQDVLDAAERIAPGIKRTPAEHSKALSLATAADIYLKFEIFQYTASFKERGGLNRLLRLTDEERTRGVIASSAGNHAQSIAYHAGRLRVPATLVMPKGTPFTKVKRTEDFGAEVVLAGKNFAEAAERAGEIEQQRGLTNIHTFDDPDIMAGHGTVAVEFLDRFPELDLLVVPVGGGGLISGIAVAAKAIRPEIKIYGVQSEIYPSMKAALAGETVEHPKVETIAEGIAIKEPGRLTKKVVAALVEDILIVKELSIEMAINVFMEVEKVVVEGAAAASLAAVYENPELFKGQKTGLVLTGANIDAKVLASSLMRGLARDGRISALKVTTPDMPGGLAKVATIIAEAGGNVVEVYHQRQFADISLKYTEIEVVVETKDAQHMQKLVAALEAAGFEVELKGVHHSPKAPK